MEETSNGFDEVLDLSDKGLCRLEKCGNGNVVCLILDRNELTRLENVESYGDLKKLSVSDNKVVRMYGVCRFVHLKHLNLSRNCILAIEGLRELVNLTHLQLSGNKIKVIEHLNSNIHLEYFDLSNNCIQSLSNLSHLKSLSTLLLDGNELKTINNASNYLSGTLTVLSIARNAITDFNQISFLGPLSNLIQLSFSGNPCINMTGGVAGFDYRPFVINWCQNLKFLDGFAIGSKESLKAEWLYSMGKGRHFRIGEHAELVDYLANVCPLTAADHLMTEQDVKLNHILNKRRQHQQQLLQEMSTTSNIPTSLQTSSYSNSNSSSVDTEFAEQARSIAGNHGAVAAKAVSPSRCWPANKIQNKNVSSAEKDSLEHTRYNTDLRRPDYLDSRAESGFASCAFLSSEGPSDVPDSNHIGDRDIVMDIETSPSAVLPLRSESQYVPVPETMLSPDFRPITVPAAPFFDIGIGSDAQVSVALEQFDINRPIPRSLQQRSSIPRGTFSNTIVSSRLLNPGHGNSNCSPKVLRHSATDSPLLRRPTQVQRLQKAARPVSLSPNCVRRIQPTSSHVKPAGAARTHRHNHNSSSSSDDNSTDSDISLSKLALVKEAVQTKIAKKKMESSFSGEIKTPKVESSHVAVGSRRGSGGSKKSSIDETRTAVGGEDKAAVVIQAMWRGYRARNLNVQIIQVRNEMRVKRAEDHVRLLQEELSKTRDELNNEKRLRALQMEAIRALWKEVQQMQSSQNAQHSSDNRATTPTDSGIESIACSKKSATKIGHSEATEQQMSTASQVSVNSDLTSPDINHNFDMTISGSMSTSLMSASVISAVSTSANFEEPAIMSSSSISEAPTAAHISHLTETCQNLQIQVQQLQEALRTMSCLMLGPHLKRKIAPECSSLSHLSSSSPFISAVASPVTNEFRAVANDPNIASASAGNSVLPSSSSSAAEKSKKEEEALSSPNSSSSTSFSSPEAISASNSGFEKQQPLEEECEKPKQGKEVGE